MDLIRRYFIMDVTQAPPEDVVSALHICIGDISTQRYRLDSNNLLIKTTQVKVDKVIAAHPQHTFEQILSLAFTIEYTEDSIKSILKTPEWRKSIEI